MPPLAARGCTRANHSVEECLRAAGCPRRWSTPTGLSAALAPSCSLHCSKKRQQVVCTALAGVLQEAPAAAVSSWHPTSLAPSQPHQQQHHQHQHQQQQVLRHSKQTVLEQALPGLVRYLTTTPTPPSLGLAGPTCVQLVRSSSNGSSTVGQRHEQQLAFEFHNLTGMDLASPQVWQQVTPAQMLQDVQTVILARPIPDPSHFCALTSTQPHTARAGGVPMSSHCCTGSAHSHAGGCTEFALVTDLQGAVDTDNCCGGQGPAGAAHAQDDAEQMQQRAQQVLQSSSLPAGGDLSASSSFSSLSMDASSESDGEAGGVRETPPAAAGSPAWHGVPSRSRRRFLRRQQAWAAAAAAAGGSAAPQAALAASSGHVTYYGLAVQTVGGAAAATAAAGEQPDGCYVLKLSHNSNISGCTCTLFTLMHVCRGAPLAQQLQDCWLAQ